MNEKRKDALDKLLSIHEFNAIDTNEGGPFAWKHLRESQEKIRQFVKTVINPPKHCVSCPYWMNNATTDFEVICELEWRRIPFRDQMPPPDWCPIEQFLHNE